MIRWRILLFSLALVSMGCGDGAPTPAERAWLGVMDTLPGGIVRVRNPHEGVWTAGQTWRIVEELRVGRIEGDGPDVFSEIAAIAVSPAGQIYVIDEQSQEIRLFDQAGGYVRTISRRGSGPGELAGGFGMAWDAQGHLWVPDVRNGRYVVFDTAGVARHHYRRSVPGVVFPWLGGFGSDGFLYDIAPRSAPNGATLFTYYRVDSQGEVLDSLPPLVRAASGITLTLAHLAVTPRLSFRFDPRGHLWTGNTREYRLVQQTLDGDTLRVVEREFTPLPVAAQERDSIEREFATIPVSFRAEAAEIPTVKPAFERIHIDERGFLFVQTLGAASDPHQRFDVFDPSGRFLGTVASPVQFTTYRALPVFVGDKVYGVTTDSLGVDYVVRARIERP